MGQDLVTAGQECDDHRDAEDEFERRPQHPHQLHEAQCAADVVAIQPLEEADLRLLAREGPDQAYAGIVFLRLGRDI